MDRRHQVFISSTFTDLKDERREVIEALLEMDAIPAGMELFAAGNTDQWTLIQQVIGQSDYYIVIVGGRYGTTTAEGISYTEMEYDYAVEQGIPVMGFVHAHPDDIPIGKSELDESARVRLNAFRKKVMQKLVKTYTTPAELGGVVSRGLVKLQKDFPRPGWVRGDKALTPEMEMRLADLRAEVAELRQAAAERRELSALPKIEGLASGDDTFDFSVDVTATHTRDKAKSPLARQNYVWTIDYECTWNDVLHAIGPSLMDEATEEEIRDGLSAFARDLVAEQPDRWPAEILRSSRREVANRTLEDVLIQFFALDLIARGARKRTLSDSNRYWALTPSGQDQVMRLRAIPRATPDELVARKRFELEHLNVAQLRVRAKGLGLTAAGSKTTLVEAILAKEANHLAPS